MTDLLKLLSSLDHNNQSENIEFAKGKYHYPETVKEAFNQFTRELRWQSKKK